MKSAVLSAVVALIWAPSLFSQSILANGTASNLSVMSRVGATGEQPAICGLVIKDAASFVLIRAVGPGLAQFGVTGYASGPSFDLVDSTGVVIAHSAKWNVLNAAQAAPMTDLFGKLGAFPLPVNSADSYLYRCLNAGSYTIVVTNPGGVGSVLSEVYFDPAGLGAFAPPSFDTEAAAVVFTRGLFAGGKSETIHVGDENVLVVQVFGSGVPVIAIDAYQFADGRWRLATEWRPDFSQFYDLIVRDGKVFAVGRTNGRESFLFEPHHH